MLSLLKQQLSKAPALRSRNHAKHKSVTTATPAHSTPGIYSDNAIYIMCLLLFLKYCLFLFSLHGISFLVTLWTFVPVMNECCDRPMNRTKWMESQQGRRTFFLANNFAGHCTWQHDNMALLLLCCYNFYGQFCFFFLLASCSQHCTEKRKIVVRKRERESCLLSVFGSKS